MKREKFQEEDLQKNNPTEEMKEEIRNQEVEETEHVTEKGSDRVSQNEALKDEEKAEEGTIEEQEEKEEEISEAVQLALDLAESKDKYLRLYSEFENFRRRTAKERMDLIKTASEDLMAVLIPVKDDFERAIKVLEENDAEESSKEGIQLIHNKFSKALEQKGLKPMETEIGGEFDSELHDAITQIPAPDEKLKGKIVDVIEKGYYLNDKVVRYAKVVIGS